MIKVAYDGTTGQILRICEGDNPVVVDDLYVVVDERPRLVEDYVVDGAIVARPILPDPDKTSIVADGVDAATFNFPEEVPVKIENADPVMTDHLEIATNTPDVYDISVDYFPYLPYKISVAAT